MDNDELHFETVDFKGRRIICTELRWVEHIAENPHHTYMDGAEAEVIDALQHPDYNLRYIDRDNPKKRVYYKLGKSKDYWIKVIVIYKDKSCSGTGEVWTAYMPDEMTDGEKPESLK